MHKTRILMCPPTYYKISSHMNADMNVLDQPDMMRTWAQWNALYNNYQRLGFRVHLIPPNEYLTEQIFTANGAWGKFNDETGRSEAVLANFLYPVRQLEKREYRTGLQMIGTRQEDIHELPEGITFEGQGDLITLADTYLFTYGIRSSSIAGEHIARLLQIKKPIVKLRLIGNKFYHGDTCTFSLRYKNALIYYPGAFDEESVNQLRSLSQTKLEVGESLANHSVCNSIYIDDVILLNIDFPDYSHESFEKSARGLALERGEVRYNEMLAHDTGYGEVLDFLWSLGYGVIPTYTSEFKKSGAGARCLTLFLD